jgi:hypothetical protein
MGDDINSIFVVAASERVAPNDFRIIKLSLQAPYEEGEHIFFY